MRRIRLLVSSVAVAATVTGALVAGPSPSGAIVGGSAAPPSSYRFMASLQRGGSWFCGGSVIASGWVLTAAHCVVGTSPAGLTAVIGRSDLSSTSGEEIAVSEIRVHPAYANNTHDVALLRLAEPTGYPAVRLAGAADDIYEAAGTPVKVAGWGDQLPTLGLFSSAQLREVDLNVVSDSECGETNFGFDAATGVCAAALLKDSCQGDSGGPLFARSGTSFVQLGVVSYGTSCAVPRFPGVYSEVNNSAIRTWISQNAGV